MSKTQITYSAAEIKQYLQGQMPAQQMYELEKAALGNPFLQDAIEGYAHTETAEEDVAVLRNRLLAAKTPVVKMGARKTIWWKYAAAVVLLGGIGYLAFILNNKDTTNGLATLDKKPTTTEGLNEVPTGRNDSLASSEKGQADVAVADKQLPAENAAPQVQANLRQLTERKEAINEVAAKPSPVLPYTVRGEVKDEAGFALSDVSVVNKDDKIVTKTDDEGKFYLKAKDSLVNASVTVVGYGTVKTVLADKVPGVVVMQNQQETNQMDKAVSPNNAMSKEISANRVKKSLPILATATPVGGWDAYKEYIQKGLSTKYDKDGLQYSGLVKLRYSLSADGSPINIAVVQSLCPACDAQATGLLKNGAKWEGAAGKNYELQINF